MSYWDEKHADESKQFQNECISVGNHIANKSSNVFLVCVDGSSQSEAAFNSTQNLRRKLDHICVFHAYCGDKPDLQPATWRPQALESKYEVELVGSVPKKCYSLVFVDREGAPVNTILEDAVDPAQFDKNAVDRSYALVAKPDFIVMGHHGRKGPKEQRYSIGSTADRALRHLHYPCLIIKNQLPTSPRTILMAVNETTPSKRGLDILMRLINPRDKLILAHFVRAEYKGESGTNAEHIRMEAIRKYYESELDAIGPVDSKFKFVEYERGADLATAIVEYVNNAEIDLFAIAPRAKRENSSITDNVINRVSVSVLLCKF